MNRDHARQSIGADASAGLAAAAADLTLGPAEVDPERAARIDALANGFVDLVVAADLGSGPYRRALDSIERLGEREIRTTTAIASRFGDRPIRALRDELSDRRPLAENHRRLRRIVESLGNLAAGSKSVQELRRAVFGAEEQVRGLVAAIDMEREALEVDNGQLNQQERALWTEIVAIRHCVLIATRIDELLEARIQEVAEDDPIRAKGLRLDVLHATRERRIALLMQLAIASQGYAALRRIEQSNLELIWLIRATTTTTVTAIRTALLAVGDDVRSDLGTGRNLGELRDTWRDVVAALDEVDLRRRQTLGLGEGEELSRLG